MIVFYAVASKVDKSFIGLLPNLGNKDIVELLVQKGANVNHGANDGNTPLIWACVRGDVKWFFFS